MTLRCGSDGLSTRVIPLLPASRRASERYVQRPTTIPPEQWTALQARHAAGVSLRELAREYGVSYETIRAIVQRAAA